MSNCEWYSISVRSFQNIFWHKKPKICWLCKWIKCSVWVLVSGFSMGKWKILVKKAVCRYDFYKIFMLVKVENSIFKHMKVVKLQLFLGGEWPLSSPPPLPPPPHTHTAYLRTLTLHYTSHCSANELLFLCIRYMWNRNCHTQKKWRLPQFFGLYTVKL